MATRDNLPRPNCDSDCKADNKGQAFINTDTRRFKIQMDDMGPPLAGPQCSINIIAVCEAFYIDIFLYPGCQRISREFLSLHFKVNL